MPDFYIDMKVTLCDQLFIEADSEDGAKLIAINYMYDRVSRVSASEKKIEITDIRSDQEHFVTQN